jgi:hypothetical protein
VQGGAFVAFAVTWNGLYGGKISPISFVYQ